MEVERQATPAHRSYPLRPQALPGDVLQLRNYAVVATTLHTMYFDDGTTRQRSEDTSRTYANHIAIIAARPEERSVAVLEQLPGSGAARATTRDLAARLRAGRAAGI